MWNFDIATNVYKPWHPLQSTLLRSKHVKNLSQKPLKMGPILTKNRVQKEVNFCHQGGFRTLNHVFQFSHLQKMSNFMKIHISPSQTSPSVKTSKTPSKNGERQNSRFQVFWLSGIKMGYFLKVPLCSRILETTYKTYRRVLKRSLFEKGVCGFWTLLGPKRTLHEHDDK